MTFGVRSLEKKSQKCVEIERHTLGINYLNALLFLHARDQNHFLNKFIQIKNKIRV